MGPDRHSLSCRSRFANLYGSSRSLGGDMCGREGTIAFSATLLGDGGVRQVGAGCAAWHARRDSARNWNRGTLMMTRKYSLVIEGEPGSYSAYVPELRTIVVTGETLE